MTVSLKNDATVRRMLRRKNGATGRELQAVRERAFPYSAWSLTALNTETHFIYTQKNGADNGEARYFLLTPAEHAERFGKPSNGNHKPSNGNGAKQRRAGKPKIEAQPEPVAAAVEPTPEPAPSPAPIKRGRKPGRNRAA